ncbi:MAG: 30S ribosomal protein S13 [Candidatus Micrarchaeia archaeon]
MEDNSKNNKKEKVEKTEKPKEKQQKEKGKPQQHEQKKEKTSSIIRIAGKDVNGELTLFRALDQVRGISVSMANAISYAFESKFNIPRSTKLAELTEEQIQNLEDIIKEPTKYNIPNYLLNRNKDMETGKNMHLVSNELSYSTRYDINRDINIRTWRGFRHQRGQKVRGQRTRSTGRTGTTIGVVKKAEAAKAAPATAGEKGEKKEEKK